MNRIITLTTDFGTRDVYVGAMKGVILGINPNATIVDITHDIAPQNIEEGAFLLAAAACYFPPNAIHVVVVDPGVGTARRPIAIQIGETVYIGPDNGILPAAIFDTSYWIPPPVISGLPGSDTPIFGGFPGIMDPPVTPHITFSGLVHLTNSEYWLPKVSKTFHGRDIFAPCAAHVSLGVPIAALGEPITAFKWPEFAPHAHRLGDSIFARIVHIDRFGNAVTNVPERLLAGLDPTRVVLQLRGHTLHGLKATFSDVTGGQAMALVGSSGYLEIAVRDGSAAEALGLRIKDAIVLGLGES